MPERARGKVESASAMLATSLFRECRGRLHRFLLDRVASEDAEDVFQTIFLRLISVKNAERVEAPLDFLFGIARHVVLEHWTLQRKRKRHLSYNSDAVDQVDADQDRALPDDSAERVNLRRQLDAALAALPEIERRVFLAVKRDGMSHEEASEALGISLPMVRKYLVWAKSRLMQMRWDL